MGGALCNEVADEEWKTTAHAEAQRLRSLRERVSAIREHAEEVSRSINGEGNGEGDGRPVAVSDIREGVVQLRVLALSGIYTQAVRAAGKYWYEKE